MPLGLRTGDVAVVDDDGFVFIVDRGVDSSRGATASEPGGRGLRPADGRFGRRRSRRRSRRPAGEAVTLLVTVRPGAQVTADGAAFMRAQLPSFMAPRSVTVLPALPLTVNGKVAKASLRELGPQRGRGVAVIPGDLDTVAGTRVFFGHQSVGQDVLNGIREIYAADGRPPPTVEDALIGENERPLLKVEDFDARLRAGAAGRVGVAMMKLCYIDITSQTDVGALFGAYRTSLADLERDFPDVAFLHVTVPLTEPGRLAGLKARLASRRPRGPREREPRAPERPAPS